MAKARQVGMPHLPQLVFGNNLKICIPVSAIEIISFIYELSADSYQLTAVKIFLN